MSGPPSVRPRPGPGLVRCLPRVFEAHAAARPQAMAIVYGEWRLSYGDLNQGANRLAHRLQDLGVGPGHRVALCLDRGPDLLMALLAVLKTGAAYLALDPHWPGSRLGAMVAATSPRALITRAALRELVSGLGPAGSCRILDLDREQAAIAAAPAGNLLRSPGPDDPCYLMFTSGSTGVPKGVAVTHGNLEDLFPPLTGALGLGAADIWTWFHSCSFGFSVWELWGALLHGGCLVVVPEPARTDGAALGELLVDEQVTVLSLTPAAFRLLDRQPGFHRAIGRSRLRYLALSGEPVQPADISRWLHHHGDGPGAPRLVSSYAVTETGGQVTLRLFGAGDATAAGARNLGPPLAGRTVRILGPDGGPLAAGEAGELWVGGPGVAAGYVDDPELTARRFVTLNPPGGAPVRGYRTGDRMRLLPDGSLEFLGRLDGQIKLRGHRLESGEVESALREHPGVADAAVALRPDGAGVPRLVAWVVAQGAPPAAATNGGAEFWPSLGDWGIYDEFLYGLMNAEPVRVAAYQRAFARLVPGRVVLDLGTGAEALLARLCVAAGARHVYGVELLPEVAAAARARVAALGLQDRITVLSGDVAAVSLAEPVSVCTQGVIGNVGSADGIVPAWRAARRWFAPDCVAVPARCLTRVAAVELPAALRGAPAFPPAALPYVERLFAAAGGAFDLRLCLRGLPPTALLSDGADFEDLDFQAPELRVAGHGAARLTVRRAGLFDGFLLWTIVTVADDAVVDYLAGQQAWLPVFVPLAGEPVPVAAGDVLEIEWRTAGEDRCPDYHLSGQRQRAGSAPLGFSGASCHHQASRGGTPLHAALLGNLPTGPARPSVTDLRNWLAARLPEYMLPRNWSFLDALPLTPAGKLDRAALPDPGRQRPDLAVAWRAPADRLEAGLVALWGEVLGMDEPGVADDFFDLGGDSILAVQLITTIQRWLDDPVPLAALFDGPTVTAMAAWLRARHGPAVARRLAAPARDRGEL